MVILIVENTASVLYKSPAFYNSLYFVNLKIFIDKNIYSTNKRFSLPYCPIFEALQLSPELALS